jgi:hypothetical protein
MGMIFIFKEEFGKFGQKRMVVKPVQFISGWLFFLVLWVISGVFSRLSPLVWPAGAIGKHKKILLSPGAYYSPGFIGQARCCIKGF